MNRTEAYRIQSAFRSFAATGHWHSPHAVTLTMKQGIMALQGDQSTLIHLDADRASQNFKHFHNVLSRKILGKPADRYGQRLRCIPIIEGGNGKRLHYHAVIECPRDELVGGFPALVHDTWIKTQWGYDQTDVQPAADAGWIDYISKFRDKPDYGDAIDWVNYHNPD